MSNIVELIAGDGISIETNPSDGSVKLINDNNIAKNQKKALENDKANENNKFLTDSEVQEKINKCIGNDTGPIGPGPNTPPPDFPKLITSSGRFVIPQNGRYRIKFCGGGGGGAGGGGGMAVIGSPQENEFRKTYGKNGNSTTIEFHGATYIAGGGTGAVYIYNNIGRISFCYAGDIYLRYNGTNGAVKGGNSTDPFSGSASVLTEDGGNGAMPGGEKGYFLDIKYNIKTDVCGGGAGGVINGNISGGDGGNGYWHDMTNNDRHLRYYGGKGGKGYGAGGGGAGSGSQFGSNTGAGGSGYLETITARLGKDEIIKINIGAGGKGGEKTTFSLTPQSYAGEGGDGAQGAVLIEWVSGN